MHMAHTGDSSGDDGSDGSQTDGVGGGGANAQAGSSSVDTSGQGTDDGQWHESTVVLSILVGAFLS